MKTIEERAEEFANEGYTLDEANFACEDGYIKGATDQREIDIVKACEWLKNYNNEHLPYTDLDCDGHCYVDMGKFAEEFCEAMKGE